ncbi:MAG: anthrone oxygenase family protein, partial [Cyanobacteria bacterium J06649_5]
TGLGNVPLNDALAIMRPTSTEGAQLWSRYLTDWTFWNHVRTVAAFLAAAMFTFAIP